MEYKMSTENLTVKTVARSLAEKYNMRPGNQNPMITSSGESWRRIIHCNAIRITSTCPATVCDDLPPYDPAHVWKRFVSRSRYEFEDGSAIVMNQFTGGWDFGVHKSQDTLINVTALCLCGSILTDDPEFNRKFEKPSCKELLLFMEINGACNNFLKNLEQPSLE